ncbi:MAG: hypothetical protein FJ271_05190 [Planctomycetes bacterium]|nr:hypothetical protein [Planctomycetota bacterium]
MADAFHSLVIDALQRAAAEPGGVALLAGKGMSGLFANSAAGRRAAQHCKDHGLLGVTRTETRGKSQVELCTITDKGRSFLLESANPLAVMEAMLQALDARRADQARLLEHACRAQAVLEGMHANLAQVLTRLKPPTRAAAPHAPLADIRTSILDHLERWLDMGSLDDCPLPELFKRLEKSVPGLTVGLFHDGLRDLHDQQRVFLHPWTGPLYELPEPALALLVGHEIAYYASLRCGTNYEHDRVATCSSQA